MRDKKKDVLLLFITVFLLLALASSCKTKKSVTEQVLTSSTSTDTTSVSKTDSVKRELRITVKDSSEVRDSVATEYIVGKYDSTANARVDTLKQYRYHYERKTTDRDKSDSEQKQSAVATTSASATKQLDKTKTILTEEKQGKGIVYALIIAVTIVSLGAIALAYAAARYFSSKK